MDIRLKIGMNGVQAFKKIKEIDAYKNVPVLAITAYAMRGDKEYFLEQGFNGYLAKPFVKDTFLEFIQQFLPRT
jgi:CheY-like chemotaxis protein